MEKYDYRKTLTPWLETESCENSMDEFNYIKKSFPSHPDEDIQIEIFCDTLRKITNENPVMIELGSASISGSFYSLLFEKWFDYRCLNICTEVDEDVLHNIYEIFGNHLKNCKLYNGYNGEWMSWQGSTTANKGLSIPNVPRIWMRDIWEENNLNGVDLMHFDIQGSEISLCEELEKNNLLQKIRFFFVSIHAGYDGNEYFSKKMCLEKIVEIFKRNLDINILFCDSESGGHGDGLFICENLNYEKSK
jgi:hypothetical protein